MMFWTSALLLIAAMLWFKETAANGYMGTIPWLFNMAVAIILYPIYLLIGYLILKKLTHVKKA